MPENNRCIIRLGTSYWCDARGVHVRRDLNFLKRKCVGFNILKEDSSGVGAEEVVPKITNLNKCRDGIYEVIIINEYRDWETGYVEDWDYKLIPFDGE